MFSYSFKVPFSLSLSLQLFSGRDFLDDFLTTLPYFSPRKPSFSLVWVARGRLIVVLGKQHSEQTLYIKRCRWRWSVPVPVAQGWWFWQDNVIARWRGPMRTVSQYVCNSVSPNVWMSLLFPNVRIDRFPLFHLLCILSFSSQCTFLYLDSWPVQECLQGNALPLLRKRRIETTKSREKKDKKSLLLKEKQNFKKIVIEEPKKEEKWSRSRSPASCSKITKRGDGQANCCWKRSPEKQRANGRRSNNITTREGWRKANS